VTVEEKITRWAGKLDLVLGIIRTVHEAVERGDESFDYEGASISMGELVTVEMLNDLGFLKDLYNRKEHPHG